MPLIGYPTQACRVTVRECVHITEEIKGKNHYFVDRIIYVKIRVGPIFIIPVADPEFLRPGRKPRSAFCSGKLHEMKLGCGGGGEP